MATKASLKGATAKGASIVSFSFKGMDYEDAVENLSLPDGDIEADRIRYLLNRAPSKYAYWAALYADISHALREAEDSYDYWVAAKYARQDKDGETTRYTSEKSKLYKVMITYSDDYLKHTNAIRQLKNARDKAEVLLKAYEMQSRTLQTIASSLKAELELQG